MTELRKQFIQANDSPSIDAFDRWRVSEPYTLFDSQQLHDKLPLFWDEELNNGTSTYNSGDASTTLAVVANSGDFVIRQTKMRFQYQPGKSTEVLTTFNLGGIQANTIKRIGYFNTDTTATPWDSNRDGYYLEMDGTDVCLCISKSGTVNKITQSNWNQDPMDGTGPSGITLDWTKCQILLTDIEWLGVGRVRMGFVVDGIIHYAHHFNHANNVTSVYCSTPNHSLRYEIRSTGGAGSLDHICCSVMSEGGLNPNGVLRSYSTTSSVTTGDGGLIALSLKDTHLDATILFQNLSILCTSNANLTWKLIMNPSTSITGFSGIVDSALEVVEDTGALSGGILLASGHLTTSGDVATSSLENAMKLGSKIDGTKDIIVLVVEKIGGGTETFYATMTWRELL